MDVSPAAVVRVDSASQPSLRARLATVLTRAFAGDPHIGWIVRRDERREDARQQLFDLMLADLLGRHGEVYATADLQAAAIWYPPGASALGLARQIRVALRFATVTGWHWPVKAYGLNRMAMRHPRAPHYFLQTLGVDPARQGYGHGTALMHAFCTQCDLAGVPGFLETGREDNVRFYARHGFRVVAEARLPFGPTLWLMQREPASKK